MTERDWLSSSDPAPLLAFLGPQASSRKLRLFTCSCCRRIEYLLREEGSRQAVAVAERYADGLADRAELALAETRAKAATWAAVQRAHGSWAGASLIEAVQAAWVAVWAACAAENTTERDFRGEEPPGAFGMPTESLAVRTAQLASWARSVAEGTVPPEERGAPRQLAAQQDAQAEGRPTGLLHELRRLKSSLSRLEQGPGCSTEETLCQAQLVREIFGNPFRSSALDVAWLRWNDGCVVRIARRIYDERAYENLPVLGDALEDAGCSDAGILAHCRGEPTPEGVGHVRGCWVLDLLLDASLQGGMHEA
jgi:hypothetical protein